MPCSGTQTWCDLVHPMTSPGPGLSARTCRHHSHDSMPEPSWRNSRIRRRSFPHPGPCDRRERVESVPFVSMTDDDRVPAGVRVRTLLVHPWRHAMRSQPRQARRRSARVAPDRNLTRCCRAQRAPVRNACCSQGRDWKLGAHLRPPASSKRHAGFVAAFHGWPHCWGWAPPGWDANALQPVKHSSKAARAPSALDRNRRNSHSFHDSGSWLQERRQGAGTGGQGVSAVPADLCRQTTLEERKARYQVFGVHTVSLPATYECLCLGLGPEIDSGRTARNQASGWEQHGMHVGHVEECRGC